VAKHEPWFKPRDEDEDERLLEGFRRPQPQQQTSSGLGCPLTAAPAVGVIVALVAVRSLTKGKK
jgi:hypothetical protein